MKLVSMKLDPKAREEKYAETVAADRPAYPWGLEVRLDNDALEKLGLDTLPEVDSKHLLTAKVCVTSVSSNESSGNGKNRNVTLQIEALALGPDPDAKDAATELYKS